MIIKKVRIKNIRSYEDQEFIFPRGSTLLSGDIGSGKTTILLAIEFALFGLQPSQKANALLRNDRETGEVSLDLEIDGKEITINRTLKKSKKSISQDYASIIIEDKKYEESVTEIKSKVLKLLNYPQEFAKKTNMLYKFTVYTPQEEMKNIILETDEARLNTLRYVFGIDRYKRIEENTSIIASKLREKIRINEIITSNVEQEKEVIIKKQIVLEELKQKKEKIEDEISKIKKVSFNQEEVNSLIQRILFQESKEKELQKEYIEVITKINADEYKKSELQMLKNKIIGLDKCPTCLQEVVEEYKKNIMNNAEREFEIINKNIDSNKGKKKELISKMEEVKKALENFKSSKSSLEMLKIRIENIKDKEKTRDEYEKQKSIIEKNIMLLKTMKENLDKLIKELDIFEIIFKERSQEVQKAK